MKVLKVLGLIFGILALLTGGGLLAGSVLLDKGRSAIEQEMEKQGFKGPVDGTVTAIDQGIVTVTYKDLTGKSRAGKGPAATQPPPKVGDTVPVYYTADDPTNVIVANIPGGDLVKAGAALRLTGIVILIVGGVLLLASILGFIFGKKKTPAVAAAPPATGPPAGQQGPPPPGGPYGGGQYPANQPPPGGSYGWGGAPTQQNQPPQGYPPQSQPPQGYPQQGQPQGYPPQNIPPQR
jgi:hypothetical protein